LCYLKRQSADSKSICLCKYTDMIQIRHSVFRENRVSTYAPVNDAMLVPVSQETEVTLVALSHPAVLII